MAKRASESDGSDAEVSGRKKRKVISLDADDEGFELLKATIADRHAAEKAKLYIDRERLRMEKEREKETKERAGSD